MPPKKTTKKTASALPKVLTEVLEKTKAEASPEPKKAARARKAKKPAAAGAVVTTGTYVVIDYPTNGETVSGLHYAIRIGAAGEGFVELSFNGGEWMPCRPSAGYWWYDWGYFTPGEYTLVARLRAEDGKVVKKSKPVKCTVI